MRNDIETGLSLIGGLNELEALGDLDPEAKEIAHWLRDAIRESLQRAIDRLNKGEK